jgi:hypothetical protein
MSNHLSQRAFSATSYLRDGRSSQPVCDEKPLNPKMGWLMKNQPRLYRLCTQDITSVLYTRYNLDLWASITVSATPDENLSPQMPFSSGAEVLWPRTVATGVADTMIEADLCARRVRASAWVHTTPWRVLFVTRQKAPSWLMRENAPERRCGFPPFPAALILDKRIYG